jgi:hypothetical protein
VIDMQGAREAEAVGVMCYPLVVSEWWVGGRECVFTGC